MKQTAKICFVQDMMQQGVSKGRVGKHLGVSRRTIIRWDQGIEKAGSREEFLDSYTQAKKGSRA